MNSSRPAIMRNQTNDSQSNLLRRGNVPSTQMHSLMPTNIQLLPGNMRLSVPPLPIQQFPIQFEKIRQDCQQRGVLFTDTTFPPSDESLFYSSKPPYPIKWLRPAEICKQMNLPVRFSIDDYVASDLKQGELGDCWVIASLAALLIHNYERELLLPRVVIPGQSFESSWYAGVFCFRFWRFGRWLDVIIDDLLPTRNGRLIFVHSLQPNEFWGALVEKAYAKLNGSYEALRGGQLADALDDFTGGLTESYSLEYNSPDSNALLPPDDIDDILIKSFERHSLVGTGIKDKNPSQPMVGTGKVLPNGLVAGHAYTLTDTRKVRLTDSRGERVVTLIRIRNPWGSDVEWSGPWSDNSPEWRSIPQADRKNVGLVKGDGEFWMSLQDFLDNFDSVDICHLPPELIPMTKRQWGVCEFMGSWKAGTSAGGRPFYRDTFWTNPQFKVDLLSSDAISKDGLCTCLVGLLQRDTRRLKRQGATALSVGYVIYKLKSPSEVIPLKKEFFQRNTWVASVDFYVNSREVVKRFTLSPGTYVIIPSTYEQNQEGDFILRVFFENPNNRAEVADNRLEAPPPAQVEEDPNLASRLPYIKSLIEKEAGKDMMLDAFQLHRVLNNLLKDDRFYSEISLGACKSLLAMYDQDSNLKLDEDEFPRLWNDIFTWIKSFHKYDANNSGTIDSIELRLLLTDMGYTIPPSILQKIIYRFAGEDRSISYSDFISVMALITKSLSTFDQFNTNGKAVLSLEDFFHVALLM